jgi:uncharacterized protein
MGGLWPGDCILGDRPSRARRGGPAVFDYITELGVGVDLTFSGHTHGGQLSLDWIHRDLNLGLVVTHYTSGWYEKSGAQLYVNRGIGTTGFPIRLGARPEITVFELVRAV